MTILKIKSPESLNGRINILGAIAFFSFALNLLLPRLGVPIPDFLSGMITGFCLVIFLVHLYFNARKLNQPKEN
jgi:hypothetical protein